MTDKCDTCGEEFDNKYERYEHGECTPESEYKEYALRRDELLEDMDVPHAPRYIYVLSLTRNSDGKTFYYIGETTNFVKRTHGHVRDADIRVRNERGDGFTEDYQIDEIVEVEPVDETDKALATYREREKMLEFAIENDTTAVLGGR